MVIAECGLFDLYSQVSCFITQHTHLISFWVKFKLNHQNFFGIFMKILSLPHGFTKESSEVNGLGAAPKFGFNRWKMLLRPVQTYSGLFLLECSPLGPLCTAGI